MTLEETILREIQMLEECFGWKVVLFDPYGLLRVMRTFPDDLGMYMIHDNSYCIAVKSCPHLWRRCVMCKWQTVERLSRERKLTYGECAFGVGEYLAPIFMYRKFVAYVSLTGFKSKRKTDDLLRLLAQRLTWAPEELLALYEKSMFKMERNEIYAEVSLHILSNLFEQLLARLEPDFDAQVLNMFNRVSPLNQSLLLRAIGCIDSMYPCDLNVADVANFCHVSDSHLQHLFKKAYGFGPYEMILQKRFAHACRLLKETELPVYQVAVQSGFSDANYFSSIFHSRYGMTCSRWRKKMRTDGGA